MNKRQERAKEGQETMMPEMVDVYLDLDLDLA